MTPVQFGWGMPSGLSEKEHPGRYLDVLRQGLEMIKGTYDSAWFVDHLQYDDREVIEGWTALTYLAAQHPDLRFGHAVLCQSFRNPALVAKMATTLQLFSGGRYILGLGAGWKEDEYLAYGYDFPPPGVRVDQLDEYVQIIRAMWTQERATFGGRYYSVKDAYMVPKPDPLPTVMIGAMAPRMIDLAVRRADWWNVSWTTPEDYRGMVAHADRALERHGRDPGSMRRTWYGGCACAPDEASLKRLMGDRERPEGGIVGTAEQVKDTLRRFIAQGVDYFILGTVGLPDFTTLETLLGDVVPAIQAETR
jgi:alkanesulfonate monooxygenase SsuD/methylene tetrahydromethanopterin reductase-like flavin-dependent oxidoreductase (luciferase family)